MMVAHVSIHLEHPNVQMLSVAWGAGIPNGVTKLLGRDEQPGLVMDTGVCFSLSLRFPLAS